MIIITMNKQLIIIINNSGFFLKKKKKKFKIQIVLRAIYNHCLLFTNIVIVILLTHLVKTKYTLYKGTYNIEYEEHINP